MPATVRVPPRPSSAPVHFVYALQEGLDGPIKIGRGRGNPLRRLDSCQTGNPQTLVLRGWLPRLSASEAEHQERTAHRKFARQHVRGEWFSPSPEVLAWVRGLERAPRRKRRPRRPFLGVRGNRVRGRRGLTPRDLVLQEIAAATPSSVRRKRRFVHA